MLIYFIISLFLLKSHSSSHSPSSNSFSGAQFSSFQANSKHYGILTGGFSQSLPLATIHPWPIPENNHSTKTFDFPSSATQYLINHTWIYSFDDKTKPNFQSLDTNNSLPSLAYHASTVSYASSNISLYISGGINSVSSEPNSDLLVFLYNITNMQFMSFSNFTMLDSSDNSSISIAGHSMYLYNSKLYLVKSFPFTMYQYVTKNSTCYFFEKIPFSAVPPSTIGGQFVLIKHSLYHITGCSNVDTTWDTQEFGVWKLDNIAFSLSPLHWKQISDDKTGRVIAKNSLSSSVVAHCFSSALSSYFSSSSEEFSEGLLVSGGIRPSKNGLWGLLYSPVMYFDFESQNWTFVDVDPKPSPKTSGLFSNIAALSAPDRLISFGGFNYSQQSVLGSTTTSLELAQLVVDPMEPLVDPFFDWLFLMVLFFLLLITRFHMIQSRHNEYVANNLQNNNLENFELDENMTPEQFLTFILSSRLSLPVHAMQILLETHGMHNPPMTRQERLRRQGQIPPEDYSGTTLTFLHQNVVLSQVLSSVNVPPRDTMKDEEDPNYDCSICLMNVEDDELVSVLSCGHWFHSECLAKWIQRRRICPLDNQWIQYVDTSASTSGDIEIPIQNDPSAPPDTLDLEPDEEQGIIISALHHSDSD